MKDIVLLQLVKDIKEVEYTEFVSATLGKICDSKQNLSSRDLTNYTAITK